MYADDLLLISSTCSDLRRMLRTVFSKPTVYNSLPSLLILRYFSNTGIPRISSYDPRLRHKLMCQAASSIYQYSMGWVRLFNFHE